MGARDVRILNGGLPAWQKTGYDVTSEAETVTPATFTPFFNEKLVVDIDQMKNFVSTGSRAILDARPKGRFDGTAPEPRAGLSSGHMPGAMNLPANEIIENGGFKSVEALEGLFAAAGVKKEQGITTSCGSGVTASILYVGLCLIGQGDISLYDGSWTQWASTPDVPIEQKAG